MKRILSFRSQGRWCAAGFVALLGAALAAQPAWAVLDYSSSLATSFKATFPGNDPGAGAPVGNPFGDWALRGPNGLTSDLTAVAGGIPASGQPGWCQGAAGACNGDPTRSYFGTSWQPGVTIDPRIAGHGPQDVLWTAPANVDMGGVSISGSIEQLFETARRMRLSVFKNGSATASLFVDALPPIVNGVILQRVNFGPIDVAVAPGDTLKFLMDGSGAGGDGISTFVAWDVTLTEKMVVPEPTTACLLALGAGLFWGTGRRRG